MNELLSFFCFLRVGFWLCHCRVFEIQQCFPVDKRFWLGLHGSILARSALLLCAYSGLLVSKRANVANDS